MEKDQTPHLARALEALDELEADVIREQRATAMPKARRFELAME